MPINFDLTDRVAVITGGAQGIGRAVAERMIASGARIALWDKDLALAERTATALGESWTAQAFAVDITDPDGVEKARDATLAAFGRIDILVNNAGISGPTAATWHYPIESWHAIYAVNVNGTFFCCRAVVPHMIMNNYGRIVNVSSIAGKEGNPNAAAYSSSKAAVIAFTKSLGKELAGYDISVNCVTPAAAKTAIFEQMGQDHIAYMLSRIPRGRFAQVEEIASLICFAASKECSFTTGSVFDVSGGRATY